MVFRGSGIAYAYAIIGNFDGGLVGFRQAGIDGDNACVGVLFNVGQRFPDDTKDVDLFVGGEQRGGEVVTPLHLKVAAAAEFIGGFGERSMKTALIDFETRGCDEFAKLFVGTGQTGFKFGDDFLIGFRIWTFLLS